MQQLAQSLTSVCLCTCLFAFSPRVTHQPRYVCCVCVCVCWLQQQQADFPLAMVLKVANMQTRLARKTVFGNYILPNENTTCVHLETDNATIFLDYHQCDQIW